MQTIKMTPEELRNAATFIGETQKEAINGEVQKLQAKVDEIEANWEGASRSEFTSQFDTNIQPILTKTLPEVLEGIAAQLKAAADTIEQADTEIANAFKGK